MKSKLFSHRSLPEMYNLDVDDDEKIYVEVSGKRDGIPAIFVHGGPGGHCRSEHHSLFNPEIFRSIIFDQRGCGKSTPYRSIKKNNTRTLVEDIGDILKIYTLTDDLRRIGVGHFKEENMVQLRDLALETNPSTGFHDIAEMVNNIPAIEVSDSGEASLRQGSEISFESSLDSEEIIIKNSSQRIIGIGFIRDNIVSPKRLLKID